MSSLSWHDVVHWLDLLRHELISTFAWEPVKTNIGAGVWWAALAGIAATLLWPPLREAVKAFFKRHTDALHKKLDHHEALMHHIILHHPDIPPFEGKVPAPVRKRARAKPKEPT
jgi:hypothetical protein